MTWTGCWICAFSPFFSQDTYIFHALHFIRTVNHGRWSKNAVSSVYFANETAFNMVRLFTIRRHDIFYIFYIPMKCNRGYNSGSMPENRQIAYTNSHTYKHAIFGQLYFLFIATHLFWFHFYTLARPYCLLFIYPILH